MSTRDRSVGRRRLRPAGTTPDPETTDQEAVEDALLAHVMQKTKDLSVHQLTRLFEAVAPPRDQSVDLVTDFTQAILKGIDFGSRFKTAEQLASRTPQDLQRLAEVEAVFENATRLGIMLPLWPGQRTDVASLMTVTTRDQEQARDSLLEYHRAHGLEARPNGETQHRLATYMSKIVPSTPMVQSYRDHLDSLPLMRDYVTGELGEEWEDRDWQQVGPIDETGSPMTVGSIFDRLGQMTSQAARPTMVSGQGKSLTD